MFASEAKAVLQDERVGAASNMRALDAFVARGVMPPPGESFFDGISRLPGAHVLRWQDGRVETERYWRPRRVEVPRTYEEAKEHLCELLLDSVRLRLRSDVACGNVAQRRGRLLDRRRALG